MASEYTDNFNLDLYQDKDPANLRDQYNAAMHKLDNIILDTNNGVTNAKNKADTALETANTAITTADTAITTANTALSTANAANEYIEKELSKNNIQNISLIGRKYMRPLMDGNSFKGYAIQSGIVIDSVFILSVINISNNNATVYAFNVENGAKINEAQIENSGHMNGACVKDGKAYFIASYNNDNTTNLQIFEIDKNLTINTYNINGYTLDKNPQFITYSKNCGFIIGVIGNKLNLVSLDDSFNVKEIITCNFNSTKTYNWQGGVNFNDEIGFITSNPNQIIYFSKTGNYSHTTNIQSSEIIGEIENANQIGKDLYINTNLSVSSESFALLFKTNSSENTYGSYNPGLQQTNPKTFYVDQNANDWLADGTTNKPFPSIALATAYMSREYSKIIVKGKYQFHDMLRISNTSGTIFFGNSTMLNGVFIKDSNISLFSGVFNKASLVIDNTTYNCSLAAINSFVKTANCTTTDGGIISDNSMVK